MSKFQSWCECAYCGHRFIETFEFPLTEVVICPQIWNQAVLINLLEGNFSFFFLLSPFHFPSFLSFFPSFLPFFPPSLYPSSTPLESQKVEVVKKKCCRNQYCLYATKYFPILKVSIHKDFTTWFPKCSCGFGSPDDLGKCWLCCVSAWCWALCEQRLLT